MSFSVSERIISVLGNCKQESIIYTRHAVCAVLQYSQDELAVVNTVICRHWSVALAQCTTTLCILKQCPSDQIPNKAL